MMMVPMYGVIHGKPLLLLMVMANGQNPSYSDKNYPYSSDGVYTMDSDKMNQGKNEHGTGTLREPNKGADDDSEDDPDRYTTEPYGISQVDENHADGGFPGLTASFLSLFIKANQEDPEVNQRDDAYLSGSTSGGDASSPYVM